MTNPSPIRANLFARLCAGAPLATTSGCSLAVGHRMTTAWLPRWRWGRAVVLAVVALLAVAGQAVVARLVPADRIPAQATAGGTRGTWPAGLREVADAAIAAAAYHFAPGADGTWAATTPAQGLRTSFGPTGPALSPLAGGWDLHMALARIGRPGALAEVEAAEVVGSAQGVEYRRGPALTEWYRNEARGLEQGFTVAAAPAGGHGPLVLELDTSGLAIALSPDGSEVTASTADATAVLRYSGLEVTDATGRRLPARLGVEGQAVQLLVDDTGAPYPLTVDPWFQQAKLTAPDGAAAGELGYSVAVSGDTAVVGAIEGAGNGSAYVFLRSGGTWAFQQKLTDPDGASEDWFGISVAVSGDTAVVGDRPNNAGAAFVFLRSGGIWTLQQKLTAPDGATGDHFGTSVAVSGDTAVVGAYEDDIDANAVAGSAYVFLRSGGAWTLQQKLTAPDGAAYDSFGRSVAVSGDTAVIGAHFDDVGANANAGSAYVFLRSGGTWALPQKLTAPDGAADDQFGISVAVSGDTAMVGAWLDDIGANAGAGSAYVFLRSGGTWALQQKLTAPDGATGDVLGWSVAISGDTAVAGAYLDDVGTNDNAGSAYVFLRSGGTWALPQKLTAPDGATNDNFGISVAISGDSAVVGAYLDDVGANANAGSAYVFEVPFPAGVWVANRSANRVTRYAANATGNAAPVASIEGAATGLSAPTGVAVDGAGRLYVANETANRVSVYAPNATGNAAPLYSISGVGTGLSGPRALVVDTSGRLYVANAPANTVTVYAPGASGAATPVATITGLSNPMGLALDAAGKLYVSNQANSTVVVFNPGANGAAAPVLTITAGLVNPQGLAVDAGGVIWVTNPNNSTVTRYSAAGALLDTISGSGLNVPAGIALDARGRVMVSNFSGASLTSFVGTTLVNTVVGGATLLASPIGVAAVPVVTVTTATPLPGATVGTPYSHSLTATGGTGPYTWALASGSLPAGLSLSPAGVVTGTPTARGTFPFSVTVADFANPAHSTTHAMSLRSRETTKPTCVWSIQTNPKRVDFTVADAGAGLSTVVVTTAVNITTPVIIPTFPAGSTAPITFSAYKADQTKSSQVALVITDIDGNQASCV